MKSAEVQLKEAVSSQFGRSVRPALPVVPLTPPAGVTAFRSLAPRGQGLRLLLHVNARRTVRLSVLALPAFAGSFVDPPRLTFAA